MAEVYKHGYEPLSVYGNVVDLLRQRAPKSGVHIDIGCGYGAIAEPLHEELGLDYIGFDLAQDGLESLRHRGFEVHRIDLAAPEASEKVIRDAVAERVIASMTIIDTLEHVTNGRDILSMLRRLTAGAPLIVSVPNVTHKDIALKLLVGRWDVTEAGLLDYTHVEFYNSRRLDSVMTSQGWREIERRDWLLEHSDQEFPNDLPLLDPKHPIGVLLRSLIDRANPDSIVNQFVRAYEPVQPTWVAPFIDRPEPNRPFLSLVLTGEANSFATSRTLEGLAFQSLNDFELIIAAVGGDGDRSSVQANVASANARAGGGATLLGMFDSSTAAITAALLTVRGRYVSILTTDDEVGENWAAAFADLAREESGAVLQIARERTTYGDLQLQGSVTEVVPVLEEALGDNPSVADFAFPAGVVRELGLRMSPALGIFGARSLVTEAARLCGLARSQVTALPSASKAVLDCNTRLRRLEQVNALPLLLPPGSAERIANIGSALDWYRIKHHELVQAPLLLALSERTSDRAPPRERSLMVDGSAPFLSIITRTLGDRIWTLRDTLMTLAGQSCTDFELLLVVHGEDDQRLKAIRGLVSDFPTSFSERVVLLQCTRPGRAAPLNDAILVARGDYVCVLDDDDFVFGHYVETFRDLAAANQGHVVRTACTRQDYRMLVEADQAKQPRSASWFTMQWPNTYDAIAHLYDNFTPFMSVAYPSSVIHGLGFRFDEQLSTAEDWDFTTRVAALCGVRSSPEVTSVYRWWVDGESSSFLHKREEWEANRKRIMDKLDRRPIALPPGSVSSVANLIDREHSLLQQAAVLNEHVVMIEQRLELVSNRLGEVLIRADLPLPIELPDSTELLLASQDRLADLLRSTSWRATRPIRALSGLISGHGGTGIDLHVVSSSLAANMQMIEHLRRSTSWKLTAPFRRIVSALRGR